MAKSAILAVRIVSDAKEAVGGISKATSALGGMVKAGAVAAAAWAGAKIVGGIKDSVKSAGDLEQSAGAIQTVFKGSAGQMEKWANGAATSVGLTKNEFNELGTLIGTQLKNGGTAMDQLAPKTNQLIGLGADLSSMFGGTSREAIEALSSALKGERDPIERYGVSLTQAKIDAEAAALGFKKVGGSLSSEANQAATLSLIMKQTADAHGNFAKESNTLQGQQQRAKAQWDNIITTIGGLFLPIVTKVFGFINTNILPALTSFTDGLGQGGVGGAFGQLFPVLGQVIGGLSPLSLAFQALQPLLPQIAAAGQQIAAAVLPALTQLFAQLAPVVASVVAAVVPLVTEIAGALIPIITDLVKTVLPPVISVLAEVAKAVLPVVTVLAQVLGPTIRALTPIVSGAFGVIGSIIKTVMGMISGIIRTVMAVVRGDWKGAWEGVKSLGLTIFQGITDLVRKYFGDIPGNIVRSLGDLGSLLINAGQSIMNGFLGGLRDAWGGVQNFVGGIADWIAQHKGPISYDRRLLDPAGRAIMIGLVGGLKAGMPWLESQVKTITGTIMGVDGLSPTVSLAGDGKAGQRLGAGRGDTYINVTVEGALDPVAVGRQVGSVLTQAMRRTGRLSNGKTL